MATDPTAPRSRRTVLAAATGVAAAGVVSALARPSAVLAGTDGDVVLGASNTANSTTTINVTGQHCALDVYTEATSEAAIGGWSADGYGVTGRTNTGEALVGWAFETGTGVDAHSGSGNAIRADSDTGTGVRATGTTGVHADGSTCGVFGETTAGQGVSGEATTGTGVRGRGAIGAEGIAIEGGTGVAGSSEWGLGVWGISPVGTGIKATSASGTALQVEGRATFTRSGRATVTAGRSSVAVTVAGGLSGTPLCFANLTSYRSGVFVTAARPNYPSPGKLTIHLNKAPASKTYVAWLVLG